MVRLHPEDSRVRVVKPIPRDRRESDRLRQVRAINRPVLHRDVVQWEEGISDPQTKEHVRAHIRTTEERMNRVEIVWMDSKLTETMAQGRLGRKAKEAVIMPEPVPEERVTDKDLHIIKEIIRGRRAARVAAKRADLIIKALIPI